MKVSEVIGTIECINCSSMIIESGGRSFLVDKSINISLYVSGGVTDLKILTCMSDGVSIAMVAMDCYPYNVPADFKFENGDGPRSASTWSKDLNGFQTVRANNFGCSDAKDIPSVDVGRGRSSSTERRKSAEGT